MTDQEQEALAHAIIEDSLNNVAAWAEKLAIEHPWRLVRGDEALLSFAKILRAAVAERAREIIDQQKPH